MKDIIRLFCMVFFLFLVVMGCSWWDILDDYLVSGVEVWLDWSGVMEKLLEGVWIIFYLKDEKGRKIDMYLLVIGGEVKVFLGYYVVVIYNYDIEMVLICGEEFYEIIQVYINFCKLGIVGIEKMVWGLDLFYVVNIDDLDIQNSEEILILKLKLKLVIRIYFFSIKVQGLSNVLNVIGSIGGMVDYYFLGKVYVMCDDYLINIDLNVKVGKIEGVFIIFGLLEVIIICLEIKFLVMMNLMIIKVDNLVQEVKINIMEVV